MSYARGRAFQSLGDSLRGIGSTIADQRWRREEQERLDEEVARRRQFEDAQMGIQTAGLGGGVGPAPTRSRELMGTGAPRPEFDPGPLVPPPDTEPAGADGFLQMPEFERRQGPVTLEESDPDYMDIADGRFHIMRPDAMERRQFETQQERDAAEREREAAEREDWVNRVGPGIDRFSSGELMPGSEGFGTEAARLISDRVDPFGLIPQPIPEPGAGGRERTGTPMSESDAIEFLRDEYGVWDFDEDTLQETFVGWSIPYPEVLNRARQISTGGDLGGFGIRPPDGGSEDPQQTTDLQGVARYIGRFPRSQWDDMLEEFGYQPDEIELIIGLARGR